ncbi:MAG: FAD-dependent oxidoreductase [Paludibacter sp.]|nr:FAD-dependent oxidoreductase [Paludibacter sp.]
MAIVKKYPSKIVSIQNSIEGVYTLELESMGKPFKYDAGQFLHFAIDEYDPSTQWPDSRCFSMQSSPDEKHIRITYAAKGQFTKRMELELEPGSEVTLKLPYGDLFTQEHNKANTVFIAGGTGITPYLSLFTDTSFAMYTKPILYAGFRDKGMNLYQSELEIAQKINSGLEIHLVYQDKDGILDIEKILNENTLNSSFFISGPPVMIKSFKQTLINKGVPENHVLTDDWE